MQMCVCVCVRVRKEKREKVQKEMLWNRFRRITGTTLSILDNYSVRPTSEGQITSVWGKKETRVC